MNLTKKRKVLFALAFFLSVLAAPLVLAGIATFDITGQTRAASPTMGALEVATAVIPVPAPTPVAAPTMPVGLSVIRVNVP